MKARHHLFVVCALHRFLQKEVSKDTLMIFKKDEAICLYCVQFFNIDRPKHPVFESKGSGNVHNSVLVVVVMVVVEVVIVVIVVNTSFGCCTGG